MSDRTNIDDSAVISYVINGINDSTQKKMFIV